MANERPAGKPGEPVVEMLSDGVARVGNVKVETGGVVYAHVSNIFVERAQEIARDEGRSLNEVLIEMTRALSDL